MPITMFALAPRCARSNSARHQSIESVASLHGRAGAWFGMTSDHAGMRSDRNVLRPMGDPLRCGRGPCGRGCEKPPRLGW